MNIWRRRKGNKKLYGTDVLQILFFNISCRAFKVSKSGRFFLFFLSLLEDFIIIYACVHPHSAIFLILITIRNDGYSFIFVSAPMHLTTESWKKKRNALDSNVDIFRFVDFFLSSWTADLTRLELSHLHKIVIVSRAVAAFCVSIHLSTWVTHSQSHFISLICIAHSGREKTESLSRRQIDVNKITHAYFE